MNSIASISAIDVHGHYGDYIQIDKTELYNRMMSGDAAEIVRRAAAVNVGLTIVSPLLALLPRFQANTAVGNEEAARIVAQTPGLKQSCSVPTPRSTAGAHRPRRLVGYRQATDPARQCRQIVWFKAGLSSTGV